MASEIYIGVTEALALSASRRAKKTSVLASGSSVMEEGAGNVEAEVNPMFLSADGTSAKLGSSKDSLVASILAQKDSPPLQLWTVFRDEFASLVDRLKESQLKAAEGSVALQKLAAMTDTSRDKTAVRRERSEVEAAPVKRAAVGAGEPGSGGASPLSPGEGSGARRGVMSALREQTMFRSPLSSSSQRGTEEGAVAGANPLLAVKRGAAAAAPEPAAESSGGGDPAATEYPLLPPGWSHRLTSKGKVLFFNVDTQESVYKLEKIPGYPHTPGAAAAPAAAAPEAAAPKAAAVAAAAAAATAAEPEAAASPSPAVNVGGGEEEELPTGWASRLTSKGKRMYFNEADGRTAWSIAKIPKD